MQRIRRLKISKASIILLLALCFQTYADQQSSAAIMQLLKNSRANMVFVEGGTFTMGQVIYQGMPTQFYTPHQVTLSSY